MLLALPMQISIHVTVIYRNDSHVFSSMQKLQWLG